MFFDNSEQRKQLSKWVIGTVAACILIFLGVRYISEIAYAVSWMLDLLEPLLAGMIAALVLNVPLCFIERHLFRKNPTPRKERARRPLAIVLSLILVLGIFISVAVLVIPELVNAVAAVSSAVAELLDELAALENSADFSEIPFGEYLSRIDIDWIRLRGDLENVLKQLGNSILNKAGGAISIAVSSVVNGIVGFVFAIYILANKEKLSRQVRRLIRVWLPEKVGAGIIHVASVCGGVFHLFIAGQTTEAIILGTLCTIGMLILRMPYAPMVGALVSVTALIPYVGGFIAAFIGAFLILTESPVKAVVFVIFFIALQQVEGNLIYPRVVGAKVNLPSMWVLAAITIGGSLGGPIGMLLGVPTVASAYKLLKEATDKRERRMQQAEEDKMKYLQEIR